MADNKDTPAGPTGPPGESERRRPAPTIEGSATEVERRPLGDEAPPEAFAKDGGPSADAVSGAATGSNSSASRAETKVSAPSGWPWRLAGAIATLAVVAIVLFAWLGWPGGDSERETGSVTAPIPATETDTAALEARVTAIERQVQTLAARPTPSGVDPALVDALSKRLTTLEAAASTARGADPALAARIAALETRIDAVAASTAGVARETEVAALTERVGAVERALQSLQATLEQRLVGDHDRTARRAIAAILLKDAVERGDPLGERLSIARAMADDPQRLAPLEAYAASGVPTPRMLADELKRLLPSLFEAANGEAQPAGFLDRLQANAEKLVRVRPVGEPSGDDVDARLARIETAVARADIDAASRELAALPAAVRAPAEAWIKAANARNAALEASRAFAADALAAFGTATQ